MSWGYPDTMTSKLKSLNFITLHISKFDHVMLLSEIYVVTCLRLLNI